MNKLVLVIAFLLFGINALAATPTMRVDYYHTGDASQEVFSLDRVVIEPLPWPGDPKQAIDSSNLGKYLFEVRDAKTKIKPMPLDRALLATHLDEWMRYWDANIRNRSKKS